MTSENYEVCSGQDVEDRPERMALRLWRAAAIFASLLVFTLSGGLIASPYSAAYRGKPVYVPENADGSQPLYKPRRFTPTGDGSLSFSRVRWSSYNGSVARATALGRANDCDPGCADGTFYKRRARVVLSQPRVLSCSSLLIYTHIRVTWPKGEPPGERAGEYDMTYCSNRFDALGGARTWVAPRRAG